MKLLDLFCGAGGAGMGYHRAGFEVVGVDINPQKNYPFPFILGDALDVLRRMIDGEKFLASDGNYYGLSDFDAIHASPPCQRYSEAVPVEYRETHPDLIAATRFVIVGASRPYVIENVEGARKHLLNPFMLCGSFFELPTIRHRFFESNLPITPPSIPCRHPKHPVLMTPAGSNSRKSRPDSRDFACVGIDWMTRREVSQAIPPAYTEFIGKQLIEQLRRAA